MKRIALILALTLGACAGNSIDGNPEPAPTPAPAADGFHFDHVLAHYEGCQNAVSTRPDLVQLRGPSCTDDGVACEDIANNRVEVWETSEAENGTPFGAATYVEVDSCDPPASK